MSDPTDAIQHAIETGSPSYDLAATKVSGKVRDRYDLGQHVLFVTTDRLSAFDRHLTNIPFKGQVLNQLSAWWFDQTASIVPNHKVFVPEPTMMLVKKCQIFPIEFVVRAYITGTTGTSLWTRYHHGERNFGGLQLPEGVVKNQALPEVIITPTTKDDEHDQAITAVEIVEQGLMTQAQWQAVSAYALALFDFGANRAREQGLILVDTKYEFGLDPSGQIMLVDEIHTPDSSRYWVAESYKKRLAKAEEPDNLDKEILRLWYKTHCDPYKDKNLPEAPEDLIMNVAQSYIRVYEMLTGETFTCAA